MHRHPQPRTTDNTYMHLLEFVSAANICIITVCVTAKVIHDFVLNDTVTVS